MKTIKIITPLFVIVLAATLFYYLSSSFESKLKKAFLEMTSYDYLSAEKTLNDIEKDCPKKWDNQYKAFLYSSQGKFDLALDETKKELQQTKISTEQSHLADIYLNLTAYAYLLKQKEDFQHYLECAKSLNQDSFCSLMQGLEHFLAHQYSQAIPIFMDYLRKYEICSENSWRKCFLESYFDQNFLHEHLAYCLIETNQFFEAREFLEKELHQASIKNMHAYFLMGMSYVKEASQMDILQRIPYYKLARYYLEPQSLALNQLQFGDIEMINFFEENARSLVNQLDQCSEESLPYFCESLCFFVDFLENWQPAKIILKEIAQEVAKKIQTLVVNHHYLTAKQIASSLQGATKGVLIENLVAELILTIKESIEYDSQPLLSALWEIVENLKQDSQEIKHVIANELIQKIYKEIENKEFSLPKIVLYISLWANIEKDCLSRKNFNYGLMHGAELLWRAEGSEKKATSLMELCFSLATDDERLILFQRTKNYLTALYRLAKEANTVKRLALIFDAMDQLHIDHQELIDKEKVANHLADAHYLFFAEHFPNAQSNAEWVLKLDPHNQDALWIMGLSCFYQGDYARAQEILTLLTYPDEKALKAMTLCQLFKAEHFEQEFAAQIELLNLDHQ